MDFSAIQINAATSVGNLSIDSRPDGGMISTQKVLNPSETSLYSVMPRYGMEVARIHPSCNRKMFSGAQTGSQPRPLGDKLTHIMRVREAAVTPLEIAL